MMKSDYILGNYDGCRQNRDGQIVGVHFVKVIRETMLFVFALFQWQKMKIVLAILSATSLRLVRALNDNSAMNLIN